MLDLRSFISRSEMVDLDTIDLRALAIAFRFCVSFSRQSDKMELFKRLERGEIIGWNIARSTGVWLYVVKFNKED